MIDPKILREKKEIVFEGLKKEHPKSTWIGSFRQTKKGEGLSRNQRR